MQMNLLDDLGWIERTWPPEKPGFRWRRKRVAGDHLGASLYELAPGESTFPYHYELGNDELLVVVNGRPTLRAPEGERELQPGDCVLFSSGPDGAHQLFNRSDESTRVLLVSNFAMPRAAVQVDSGKIMIRWGAGPDDRRWFRLEDEADSGNARGSELASLMRVSPHSLAPLTLGPLARLRPLACRNRRGRELRPCRRSPLA